ncbi:hypothetical protein VMCG_07728 [Cytospora schulzeri]|uniref:Uncharacterized protein n=1 Tax=Cytospora schulzeri TaxID=448051 RepID=A0A423VYR0_9PEZI|nr:hypothetical protein VMCG_07728 [Valsa malicola]
MSSPFSYGSQPSVEGWLDGQYEYMVPDKDIDEPTGKPSYIPRDAYRDHTPDLSDEGSSRGKGHRSSRDKYRHSSAKERYTPLSPPPENDLARDRDTHRHGDRDERRRHHDRDTKYPPKADNGRRRRPPLNTATTSPQLKAGRPTTDEDSERPRHRRYSQTYSPPAHLDDTSPRHHKSRRHEDRSPSPPPSHRTSKKKDIRDRDTRSHHGGTSSSATKPHRPSLSRSQTAPYNKDAKKSSGSSSSGRSFSFLNDPRFMTAAEAALQAGATAALASGGGKWGKDKGAKVLGAGLSAAALSALKPPAAAEVAAAPPPPPPPGPGETAGDKAGRYAAGRVGRRDGTKRRHH